MIIPDLLGDRASSVALTPPEIQRYARHLIMPEVAMAGAEAAQGREGALHRHRRPGLAAVARTWPRPGSARSAWSISTSSTSPTSSARSSTSPATSAGPRSPAPRRSSRRSTPT